MPSPIPMTITNYGRGAILSGGMTHRAVDLVFGTGRDATPQARTDLVYPYNPAKSLPLQALRHVGTKLQLTFQQGITGPGEDYAPTEMGLRDTTGSILGYASVASGSIFQKRSAPHQWTIVCELLNLAPGSTIQSDTTLGYFVADDTGAFGVVQLADTPELLAVIEGRVPVGSENKVISLGDLHANLDALKKTIREDLLSAAGGLMGSTPKAILLNAGGSWATGGRTIAPFGATRDASLQWLNSSRTLIYDFEPLKGIARAPGGMIFSWTDPTITHVDAVFDMWMANYTIGGPDPTSVSRLPPFEVLSDPGFIDPQSWMVENLANRGEAHETVSRTWYQYKWRSHPVRIPRNARMGIAYLPTQDGDNGETFSLEMYPLAYHRST